VGGINSLQARTTIRKWFAQKFICFSHSIAKWKLYFQVNKRAQIQQHAEVKFLRLLMAFQFICLKYHIIADINGMQRSTGRPLLELPNKSSKPKKTAKPHSSANRRKRLK